METRMIITSEADVTAAVVQAMSNTDDARQREIMESLVRHLHGFVREVSLTEEEFRAAVALVNKLGQQTTDTNNEAMLMAGTLGVSSLVCILNNGDRGRNKTSQNLLGPFWRLNSPVTANGDSIVRSPSAGAAAFVTLRIVDQTGQPIVGAEVDIWHASPVGLYEVQDRDQAPMNLRGKFATDEDGRIWFRSVKPSGYPIPTDGVVGELLMSQHRHPFRPAHIHALVFKSGFKTLISQIYDAMDPYLETDVQFGVRSSLVAEFQRHDEPHPSAKDVEPPWYSLDYELVMEPGEARLPEPPIK
jgi:catechol 1,2-dioxygenase